MEENIDKLPESIQMLYNSHQKLSRIIISFEYIKGLEFTADGLFEKTMMSYMNFLENSINDFYVNNYYSKIDQFNKMISTYLDTPDFTGKKHKDNINNPNLLSNLERIIFSLEESRIP